MLAVGTVVNRLIDRGVAGNFLHDLTLDEFSWIDGERDVVELR